MTVGHKEVKTSLKCTNIHYIHIALRGQTSCLKLENMRREKVC